MTLLNIIMAVQFPALMWGAGTAIGELPPYFVARAGKCLRKCVCTRVRGCASVG